MSPLEDAALQLGEQLRKAEFGQRLQELHPSLRADVAAPGSLAFYEVNSAPAIRRTFQTLEATRLAREPLPLSDDDRAYIEWVRGAANAVQRIAGKCWAPMRADVRTLVVDQDDLGPAVSPYIPGSRLHQPGPALRFAGLDDETVQDAIDQLVATCRTTPCYQEALEQTKSVEADRALRVHLTQHRQRVLRALRPREQELIGEFHSRAWKIVDRAYRGADADLSAVATAVRAHNELVNYILFALLGLSETAQTYTIGSESGPIRARRKPRLLWAHFATYDEQPAYVGHPPAPFLLNGNTPLDGLYILEGLTFRFSGRELMDVNARRLRELEEAPRQASRRSS